MGYLLVGLLSLYLLSVTTGLADMLLAMGVSRDVVDRLLAGQGWRLLMITGALPALLIFFIRLFVPESHRWESASAAGKTSHWATRDLLGVLVGGAAALGVVYLWSPAFRAWAVPAAAPGAPRFPPPRGCCRCSSSARLWASPLPSRATCTPSRAIWRGPSQRGRLPPAAGPSTCAACSWAPRWRALPLLGTWGTIQWAPRWSIALAKLTPDAWGAPFAKEYTQIASSTGAIVGCILAALAAGRFGRRITYAVLCLASFASVVMLYKLNHSFGIPMLASVFLAGGITAAFYGWFPLYLPELYPTAIRATSQGFAYNFGRVLSAVGTLQAAVLTGYFAQHIAAERIGIDDHASAGATLAAIYLVGLVIIWLGPETKGQPLPE